MLQKNRSVCMFVWNMFTNDARVLRECTALTEAGYRVSLICLRGRNQPPLENAVSYTHLDVYKRQTGR